MRGFFLLLLISNLAFLGWQIWGEPQQNLTVTPNDLPTTNEGLRLLSELDAVARPAPRQLAVAGEVSRSELITPEEPIVELPPEQVPEHSGATCYQSFPLTSLEEAEALQQRLSRLGIDETRRVTVKTIKVNYWVMLRPYESLEKASEALDILKSRRMRDLFIVRSGRYENAISLGVYSTLERAAQRSKEITDLKVRLRKPQIEQLELPAKRLVVTFRLGQLVAPEGLADMLGDGKKAALEKIPCN